MSRTLTRTVTLPLVAAGGAAVKMAADFDQSMRNVNSIMGASERQLGKFSEQILGMSERFPQSAKVLADGLYDIASSGFQGADAMQILETSARAASAGMTDTAVASKAIVSVLNAYGLEAKDAAAVSDVLFKGVDKGVMSFEELASTLGDYVGAASQLAVPIQDVVAAQAAMTLTGLNAAEAATSLNNVMRALLKPSTDMTKALKAMGYESGQAALEAIGLQGIIEGLAKGVGDNKQEWLALFPEIRAARGAMALAANDGDNLRRVMDEMARSTGATSRAFEEQSKGAAFQFTIMMNKLRRVLIEVGNELIPIIMEDIIPAVQSAIRWWKGLSDETKGLVLKLAAFAALAGPLIRLGGALGGVVGWIMKWSKVGPLARIPMPGGTPGVPPMPGAPGAGTGIGPTAGGLAFGSLGLFGRMELQLENVDKINLALDVMRDRLEAGLSSEGLLDMLTQKLGANRAAIDLAIARNIDYRDSLLLIETGLVRAGEGVEEQLTNAFLGATKMTDRNAASIIALTERINGISGPLTEVQRGYLEWFLRFGDVNGAIGYLRDQLRMATKMTDNNREAIRSNRRALVDATGPAKRLANEFVGVGNQAQGADRKVGILNRGLKALPKRTVVTVDANITPAMVALRTLRGGLSSVGAVISDIGASVPQLHGGGHVERSGLAVVHAGEDVITREQRYRASRRGDSVHITLDRRHFAGALATDAEFRGT